MKVAVIGIWIRGMQPGSMISGFCSDFICYLFQVLLGCDFRSKCSAKKITESRLLRFLVYQNNALFFTILLHRRDISTFLNNLTMTMKTIYFLNVYHLAMLIILTTLTP